MKKALLARLKSGGFTMIELLIVIAILGILAVLVLSAINPIEQINRGRDTGKRSDAEQLLGAIERYAAFQRTFPWRDNPGDTQVQIATLTQVTDTDPAGTSGCPMITRLSQTDPNDATCVGTEELKASYVTRVTGFDPERALYVHNGNSDDSGFNTYVCFSPESNAFSQEAQTRCDVEGLPTDFVDADGACPDIGNDVENAAGEVKSMICIP